MSGSTPGAADERGPAGYGHIRFRSRGTSGRAAAVTGGEVEAERLVGLALIGQGRADDAELILGSLTPAAGTDQGRVQVAVTRAFNLYWALDLPAQAKAVLHHAEPVLTDPGARAEVAAVLAGMLLLEATSARPFRPWNLSSATQTRIPGQQFRRWSWPPALFHAGRCEQAITAAHRAFESEEQLGEEIVPWGHLQIAADLANAYLAAGRINDADTLATEDHEQAIEHVGPPCGEGDLGLHPGTNRSGPRPGPHRTTLAA